MKKLVIYSWMILLIIASCIKEEELNILPGKSINDSSFFNKFKNDSFLFKKNSNINKPLDSINLNKADSLVTDSNKVTIPSAVVEPSVPAQTPPSAPVPVSPSPAPLPETPATEPVVVPNNSEKFNIVFSHNFNNNAAGNYAENEWLIDWNSPAWANHKNGYGKILVEGKNKYLSQSHAAGTFGASDGYQWQTKFSKGYNELYLSYRIKFSDGFSHYKLDGKLPGLSGGASNNGGNLPNGKDGWSARYMFKGNSIKFYLYYPEIYKLAGDATPVANKDYFGQGPYIDPGYNLKTNVWYTITQRIVMNTPGKSDGLVEGFFNGKLVATQTGIRFRDISTLMIDRLFFGNFFGGSGISPVNQETISFDDFYVFTYAPSVNFARGNVSNPIGTIISLPQ